MSDFEKRLVAHFNRPKPMTISDLATIPPEEWNLNEPMIARAQEIVAMFTAWDESTGPCPINLVDRPWFTKLCALGEWIALLEAKIDPESFSDEDEPEDDDAEA